MLQANERLISLNLEGNCISSRGVLALAAVLPSHSTLRELKLAHQYATSLSAHAELQLARSIEVRFEHCRKVQPDGLVVSEPLLKPPEHHLPCAQASSSLHKVTVDIRSLHCREVIQRACMRNLDMQVTNSQHPS